MSTAYQAIKRIKDVKILARMVVDLEAQHRVAAGPRSRSADMAIENCKANYKVGGVAYLRNLCVSHANSVIHAACTRQHFQPASDETLAWGGFLGGENLIWTDANALAQAEEEMVAFINMQATA